MSRGSAIMTALVAGSALAGAGYLWTQRRPGRAGLPPNVIPIVTPVIDMDVAQDVIAAMERIPGEEVTLVIHTAGGCVVACVLIANALRTFSRSRAVVPYMAMSGGTLIALNARELYMGEHAALSAVDPIIRGERVRHLPPSEPTHALAKEYELAVNRFLRDTLVRAWPGIPEPRLDALLELFLGERAPHAWPIRRGEIEPLGLQVEPAPRVWADLVDAVRRRWR